MAISAKKDKKTALPAARADNGAFGMLSLRVRGNEKQRGRRGGKRPLRRRFLLRRQRQKRRNNQVYRQGRQRRYTRKARRPARRTVLRRQSTRTSRGQTEAGVRQEVDKLLLHSVLRC